MFLLFQVSVVLQDPSLPFVLLHNEVNLRAKCFVRIPVRFVPVTHNKTAVANMRDFECILNASVDGRPVPSVKLIGSAY